MKNSDINPQSPLSKGGGPPQRWWDLVRDNRTLQSEPFKPQVVEQAAVKAVRDGKFRLLVKALIIETNDGEIVKMTVSKQNEWKDAITKTANGLR